MAAPRRDLEDDLDALYRAPLAEFTPARNDLAKRLAASGRKEDAARVKAIKKPSSAAWAVNQLALSKSVAFGALLAAAARMRRPADLKDALRERRASLTAAAREAEAALAASGHAPNPDVQRRISGTLEALAAYSGRDDGPAAGRLTEDLPAPGFDEIASLGLLGGSRSASPSTSPSSRRREPLAKARLSLPSKAEIARANAEAKRERRAAALQIGRLSKKKEKAQQRFAAAEKALAAARHRRSELEGSLSKAVAEETSLAAEAASAREALDAASAALEGSRRGQGD